MQVGTPHTCHRICIDRRSTTFIRDAERAADCLVVGAGVIGMSIALEIWKRGGTVVIVDRARSMSGASIAAAGMLAVDDPYNPDAIHAFSRLSANLYPSFLDRIADLSGLHVPFQTDTTVQFYQGGSSKRFSERSIDPRQLAVALRLAVNRTPIRLLENTCITAIRDEAGASRVHTADGSEILAKNVIYTVGAWTARAIQELLGVKTPITPRKGQMLRVRLPESYPRGIVHRSEHLYIVPRHHGPQSGSALIGATVEDCGFDMRLNIEAAQRLRSLAMDLVPSMCSEAEAPLIESWVGLRPYTPDSLPIIGAIPGDRRFIASGHYRNGILLAPGTATVVADSLQGRQPEIDLQAFSPVRFPASNSKEPHSRADIRANTDDNDFARLR